ncbi:hypothetical protein [Burkholderia multivorans]|uniref:hypothetical protein n=1 Tax=Burkholderia multivorans TaxID=87883 RepID=UPI0015906D29|nr:hypothetical protein [Burkholderia multivorans]
MTTQAEEQLEQASAPKSFDVVVHLQSVDAFEKMTMWCELNTSDFDVIGTDEYTNKKNGTYTCGCLRFKGEELKFPPSQKSGFDVPFRFTSELDAVAFRLMFSEYL